MTSSVLTAHDRAASPAPSSPSRSTWREAASALQPVPRRGPPPLRRGPDFEGNAPTTDGFPAYRAETPSGASPKSDRKSTRLNSSHGYISYAVFCLKKKKKKRNEW